jgi:hypothetical protein
LSGRELDARRNLLPRAGRRQMETIVVVSAAG